MLVGPLLIAYALPVAAPVDYAKDVKPLLKARCVACHGPLKQKGRLRLDSGDHIRKGGRGQPVVEPGKPDDSELILRVTAADAESRMPPDGPPLTAKQIADLRAWVARGAPTPPNDPPEPDPRDHWAFRRPQRPEIPSNKHQITDPIDRFLLAELNGKGIAGFTPGADKPTLLRRVYLDLIGLPPTRQELAAFLADPSPNAYERVVDRLLADPRHGERWARHWMDVWRYSDWYGRRSVPDVMNSYPMIWRWRDWIVRSLNADKGYDRMVVEMLAADEFAPGDAESAVATGFLVRNWFKWNYHQWMKDSVEHTAKAFLGLTMNCCHCHDHKYDPLSQREYFQFRAFFEPLELRHDRVPGEPDPGPFRKYVYTESYGPISSGLVRVFDERPDAPTYPYTNGDERNVSPGIDPVPAGAPAALGGDRLTIEPVPLPPAVWYPGLQPFVRQEERAKREAAVRQAEQAARRAAADVLLIADKAPFSDAWWAKRVTDARLAAARADRVSLDARIKADDAKYLDGPGDPAALATAASKADREYRLAAAVFALWEAERAAARAAPKGKGKEATKLPAARAAVEAAAKAVFAESAEYTPLTPVYPRTSSGRRLALAKWIASPDNPLTARVAVNHLWRWHFGRPLVDTTADFGRNGKPPTHPALLDWLAVEFMEHGWSSRHLHRLIVTSAAYRQSSSAPHPADPDNVLLGRFPGGRMEAEVVRDSVLHLAGDLDATVGGPEVPHERGLTSRRRSLYFAHHGESKMGFLELFDAANPCDCYRRAASVVPQQALALSNSELVARSGRRLARTLAAEVPDRDEFVKAAFLQVLGRPPTAGEAAVAARFLDRQGGWLTAAAAPAAAVAGFGAAGGNGPALDPDLRARENLVIALFNHTDFVTVR